MDKGEEPFSTALHQTIRKVRVGDKKKQRVLDGIDPQHLGRKLVGNAFRGARRHGKYCFAELKAGGNLAFHYHRRIRLPPHIENLRNFRKQMRTTRAVARMKPVVLLKAGQKAGI